jgi:hypothetical protein
MLVFAEKVEAVIDRAPLERKSRLLSTQRDALGS